MTLTPAALAALADRHGEVLVRSAPPVRVGLATWTVARRAFVADAGFVPAGQDEWPTVGRYRGFVIRIADALEAL